MTEKKKAKRLSNQQYPEYKIYVPADESYRDFHGGILVLEADDPAYDHIMSIAAADPTVTIHDVRDDGNPGDQVKAAAQPGLVCEGCNPPQSFADDAQLQAHVSAVHTSTKVDDSGNTAGGDTGGPSRVVQGTVTTVPPATRSGKK